VGHGTPTWVQLFTGMVACDCILVLVHKKKELALRSCILYGGSFIGTAFGSLMAAGISSGMEDKLNTRAWRWLFYIEGAITIFVGLQPLWLLPDHPHNTWWFTPAERRLARVRLAEDTGEADEDGVNDRLWRGLKLALQDPKVYIFALYDFCVLLGLGFVQFFPTSVHGKKKLAGSSDIFWAIYCLTQTMGFSSTITLLLASYVT